MNYLSDTLTVALVLVLLFGSIALYLYTRIQQCEYKINLLETILLDIKLGNEVTAYPELPADELSAPTSTPKSVHEAPAYTPFSDEADTTPLDDLVEELVEEEPSSNEVTVEVTAEVTAEVPELLYENMTHKELQALAKSKGLNSNSKKASIIDALKGLNKVQPGTMSSSALLETSTSISDDN
jgi:hypothetical protein